jgi:hypothetical protein
MNALDEVKSYMEFWGWSNGGGPGSVKRDADGMIIAEHGGAEWIKDVDEACAVLDRLHKRVSANR